MRGLKKMKNKVVVCVVWVISFFAVQAVAQSSGTALNSNLDRGFSAYSEFQGTSSTLGQVFKWDTSIGYNFSRHVGVDVGLPMYFAKASSSSSASSPSWAAGPGNAYFDLRLAFRNPALNYGSTVTVSLPTGSVEKGFSTGRVTADWNNHFDHSFGRLTPFAEAGLANTVSDTRFFTRPFSTLGFVTHAQGGTNIDFARVLRAGAGLYVIAPSGSQKVFSKLVGQNTGTTPTSGTSTQTSLPAQASGRTMNVFQSAHLSTGGSEIDRDNGFSTWLDVNASAFVDMEVAFTRSMHYDLNTVSFTLGLNLKALAEKNRH